MGHALVSITPADGLALCCRAPSFALPGFSPVLARPGGPWAGGYVRCQSPVPASNVLLKRDSTHRKEGKALLTMPPTSSTAGNVGHAAAPVVRLGDMPGTRAKVRWRVRGACYGIRTWRSVRSATSLSHRHTQIEREGHVMIRICGFRGLAVGLFAACAAVVAAP